jgi:hypothetical protein
MEQAELSERVSKRITREADIGNQIYDGPHLALMFLMVDRCNPLETL